MRPLTILVATDLSELSDMALRVSWEWSRLFQKKLFVFHADTFSPMLETMPVLPFPDEPLLNAYGSKIKKSVKESFESQLKRIGVEIGYGAPVEILGKIEFHSISGPVEDVLLQGIEKSQADIMVLGSHTHGLMDTLVSGSVGEKMLRAAPIPILVARDDRPQVPKNILVCCDFSPVQEKMIDWAKMMAGHFAANLHFMTVVEYQKKGLLGLAQLPPEEEFGYYPEPMEKILAIMEDTYRDKMKSLELSLREENIEGEFTVVTAFERTIDEEIQNFIKDKPIDLIFLGGHSKNFLERFFMGSVTTKMMRNCEKSLMIVNG